MNLKKMLKLCIMICILCMIGISYAYWTQTFKQVGVNKALSSCFSLALTNEINDINLQKQYPISDEDGKKLVPFQFSIENTCDLFASYTISLELLEGTTLSSGAIKTQLNKEAPINLGTLETTTTTLNGSVESRILAKGNLGSGDKEDYALRLWMDGDLAPDTESMNKTLLAQVVIKGEQSTFNLIEQGITTLSDAMLANEYQTSVEAAKRKIAAKDTPNFAETSPIITYQEVHEDSNEVVINVDKPHPSLNGNESLGGQNLTENAQKLIFGKSYSFKNTNPPSYTLEDRIEVDPTTITDFINKDYYFCGSGINVNSTTGIISTGNNYANCGTIYKVNSISVTTSGTENTNTYRLRYRIRGYKYGSTEYESDRSEKGLYQMNDDYTATTGKPSYYYRGSVNNNYVKFAGYYWRIIRQNGDGSVRLIYNGNKSNQKGSHLQITGLAFNTLSDNPAHVGYMYGSILNTSYEQTHANENSSIMKTILEDWYQTNIYDKGYHEYVSDEIFCNDRSVILRDGYTTNATTNFGSLKRLMQNKEPGLICPQENDEFTTKTASIGNKATIYPVGLVTADELSMAGGVSGKFNNLFYLCAGINYWTMTPTAFHSGSTYANEWFIRNDGFFTGAEVSGRNGIRPVINIKPDVEITDGIGTANDPFIIN